MLSCWWPEEYKNSLKNEKNKLINVQKNLLNQVKKI